MEYFDGIMLIDDVIKPEFAKELINHINTSDDTHKETHGKSTNVVCDFIQISENDSSKFKKIDDQLFKIVGNILQNIWDNYEIKSTGDSGYCLRKIYGETRRHMDGVIGYDSHKDVIDVTQVRNMAVIIALNDDYEDGEFYFPYQDKKIKLKKYQAIAFPPYWTHPHEVSAPTNGTFRYTINTWLYGK